MFSPVSSLAQITVIPMVQMMSPAGSVNDALPTSHSWVHSCHAVPPAH